MKWQTFNTLPADGSDILIRYPHNDHYTLEVAYVTNGAVYFQGSWGWVDMENLTDMEWCYAENC